MSVERRRPLVCIIVDYVYRNCIFNTFGFDILTEDLIAPNGTDKSISDMPSMLTSGDKNKFLAGPPSDSMFFFHFNIAKRHETYNVS